MKGPISFALLGSIFIIYLNPVVHSSSTSQTWNFKETFSSDRLEGESFVHDARSKIECGSICSRHSCKSFGIDMVNLKCYLYNFHVWFGGKIVEGGKLTYYWLYLDFCPESYTFNSEIHVCYKINLITSTWTEVMGTCIEDGGLLAMLDSTPKYNITNGLNNEMVFFLGATDENNEGQWKWFNGADILFWNIYNPDGIQTENCLAVISSDGVHDYPCNESFPYICEIPVFEIGNRSEQ